MNWPRSPRFLLLLALGLPAAAAAWAQAAAPAPTGTGAAALEPALLARVRELAQQAAQAAAAELPGARVHIELGTLDARLRLAPCAQVQPYLPPGQRLWGRSRIGLRCVQGAPWNVYLPVTVKVFMPALVLAQALPAGTLLEAAHLGREDVDVAAGASAAVTAPDQALGRALARNLNAGDTLRRADLRPRQWFAAGDTVRLVALGEGYSVSGEAQALGPGLEGQSVRLRTDSGRIVSALPVAPRQAEVTP
ncbi:flagellar basal body P-ring formation chaperone FlgA [Azohydromonas aeria]|uniref:flagellar basal body P-ring formation chaperone FlgA n=1 Tax=Azohydromonas aeria TaxID=2590212 RepID=UPI001E2A4D69|nr:flagellar basal body P-ring formation chaperone FlgA [Azohydromonas aeria]